MGASQLVMKGVSKRFGNVTAVDRVSLEVQEGESIVLLGPSGCGKTTTLRMVAGFLRPDSGEIWIGGRSVATPTFSLPPERRGLSMVFQNYAVWPHMTVFENIAFGLRVRKRPESEIRSRVQNILQVVRMEALATRVPGELSGGQQQRVALARALILEPAMLLFDEPLSNLDATLREEMRFEIREIIRRLRITSLYVTHDQAEAMVLGDRIVIMREGRLEQIGTPEEIYWHSRTRFVASFVGVANLLPGEVTEAGPAEASVAVAGVVLRGSLQDGESRPRLHEQVCLVVRPEDLEVWPCDQGPEENSLTGAIAVRTFLGHTVELRVDTAAGRLRAMASTGCPHREGESVRLYIPPQRAVILRD